MQVVKMRDFFYIYQNFIFSLQKFITKVVRILRKGLGEMLNGSAKKCKVFPFIRKEVDFIPHVTSKQPLRLFFDKSINEKISILRFIKTFSYIKQLSD